MLNAPRIAKIECCVPEAVRPLRNLSLIANRLNVGSNADE